MSTPSPATHARQMVRLGLVVSENNLLAIGYRSYVNPEMKANSHSSPRYSDIPMKNLGGSFEGDCLSVSQWSAQELRLVHSTGSRRHSLLNVNGWWALLGLETFRSTFTDYHSGKSISLVVCDCRSRSSWIPQASCIGADLRHWQRIELDLQFGGWDTAGWCGKSHLWFLGRHYEGFFLSNF
jgi:hypothetical protein